MYLAPTRKADQIAEDLLARIVSGELPRGSLLPHEPELAVRYGANRSVVREAIKALEVHRLVRPVKRRGTEVLDPTASLSPAVLRAMIAPPGRRVDPAMLGSFLELRANLDALMNGLAAERRTDADLERLDRCVVALEGAFTEPRAYVGAVEEMALCIARATHNPIFEMLVHWHRQVSRDLEDLLFLVRFPTEPHLEGCRILVRAIRDGDAILARDLSRSFHEWANRRLLEAVGGAPREGHA